jgi:hypothetical protein
MTLSARNQLKGTVEEIQLGGVMAHVVIRVGENLIEAADGYRVVFALAEIDPAFATREIILADERDGKLLDAKEGPLRIVAPGDRRPARWARQVVTFRLTTAK